MADGPGKYDAIASHVAWVTGAQEAVLVVVLGGTHGDGASYQTSNAGSLRVMAGKLRDLANQMESDAYRAEGYASASGGQGELA